MLLHLSLIKRLTLTLLIYNILLWFYEKGIRLASLWNSKAKLWVDGRRNIFESLPISINKINSEGKYPLIWMHCASLGEFEQGRPVLESIRKNYPNHKIVLSFFSPSGFEIRKNYKEVDLVCYLPMDSKKNAIRFLEIINPSLVIFVKYEFWFHYLHQLKKKNIPVLLISAIFRPQQPFFEWYGKLHRYMLSCFSQVFVQDDFSKSILSKYKLDFNVRISGDTRFDRVSGILDRFEDILGIKDFTGSSKTIVAGSTWPADEKILQQSLHTFPDLKLIIAPHEINVAHVAELKKMFPSAVLFSELRMDSIKLNNSNCLIIDNIGMLSRLYNYADIAYVGGGFNKSGIHNILEAAVYNKPVLFGPNYSKFKEARDLVKLGGAISIIQKTEFEKSINIFLNDSNAYKKAGDIAGNYVKENTGATLKILSFIQENRLLTN